MTIAAHTRGERGSALTLAIVLAVLGMIVIAAITAMLDVSGQRGKSRSDRQQSVAVVDRALASIEYALETNLTNDHHGFRLDADAMRRLASADISREYGIAEPVPNARFGADFRTHGLDRTWMPPAYAHSMQHRLADGRTSWWQLVSTVPPGSGNASLVAYVRTWIASGGERSRVLTEPRIARAELRPGRFSDYQMLVDGPLVIGGGTTIRGRVHTNGYPDAYLVDAFTRADRPLVLGNAVGRPRCEAGAGFSTAKGRIQGSCTGFSAPRDEANGRLIDLLRGQAHLAMLKQMCGGGVFCPGGTPPHRINLSSNTVNGRGIPGGAQAVYLEGDATITGTTRRHITIGIAGRAASYGAFGSASLSLLGSGTIGSAGTGSPADGIVGLVVAGDIAPRFDLGSCPRQLNAAIISTSGALTMPAQYRVPVQPAAGAPTCGSFRLVGSLGSHYAPLMYLSWGSVEAGYINRDYDYDIRLRETPPPLFPLTGPWQVSSWKDAIPECLTAANRGRADCG